MGIASGSKKTLLGKNYHFFLIFSKFDMILLIACTQRARIFEPFIRGTYNKKFFQSTMKSTQLISIPSSIYIASFYILSSSPWQTCIEVSWHLRQGFYLNRALLLNFPLSTGNSRFFPNIKPFHSFFHFSFPSCFWSSCAVIKSRLLLQHLSVK